jgi:hypothetical protein
MAADIQGQDPKTLWQDQELETDPVTLDHIHGLARRLDRKTRLTPVVFALSLVATGYLTGQLWMISRDVLQHVAAILFVAGELGCFLVIYRSIFPSRDPAMPASAFLRHRLRRKLYYLQGGWALALLPILPFVLVEAYNIFKNGHGLLWAKLAPFAMFVTLVVVVVVRARIGARKARVELQELNELLKR